MNSLAQRFSDVMSLYLRSDLARIYVPSKHAASEPEDITRKRNSQKAAKTRQGRYGKSKLKRSTREDMKKDGQDVKE